MEVILVQVLVVYIQEIKNNLQALMLFRNLVNGMEAHGQQMVQILEQKHGQVLVLLVILQQVVLE